MKSFFMKVKERMRGSQEEDYEAPEETDEGYLELSTEGDAKQNKVTVRPFVLEDFADTKHIMDALREGYTIALINIRPLKDRDLVELKRAINKIKKTCDALEGDIAGFSDDWICVTPSFAEIFRESRMRRSPAETQEIQGEDF